MPGQVGCIKKNVLEQPFHEGVQPPGPDVFRQAVYIFSCFGDVGHGFILEYDLHPLGPEQSHVLQQKGIAGLGQYAVKLFTAQ